MSDVPARPTVEIDLSINGAARRVTVEPRETLAETLRGRLALAGTKVSCDAQVCGTCTVLLDGQPVSSCTLLSVDAEGHGIETVEGLQDPDTGRLSGLQEAFIEYGAFQCGFCTPGFLMAATGLLREEPAPTRASVIEALEGNICRCTGYEPIVSAVLSAARAGQQR